MLVRCQDLSSFDATGYVEFAEAHVYECSAGVGVGVGPHKNPCTAVLDTS